MFQSCGLPAVLSYNAEPVTRNGSTNADSSPGHGNVHSEDLVYRKLKKHQPKPPRKLVTAIAKPKDYLQKRQPPHQSTNKSTRAARCCQFM